MKTRPSYSGDYTFEQGPKKAITVRPGKAASFDLAPQDKTGQGCAKHASAIRIIPPNNHRHLTVRESFPYCNGRVAVSNVAKGGNGQPPPGV